jgi:hypothetical protein
VRTAQFIDRRSAELEASVEAGRTADFARQRNAETDASIARVEHAHTVSVKADRGSEESPGDALAGPHAPRERKPGAD